MCRGRHGNGADSRATSSDELLTHAARPRFSAQRSCAGARSWRLIRWRLEETCQSRLAQLGAACCSLVLQPSVAPCGFERAFDARTDRGARSRARQPPSTPGAHLDTPKGTCRRCAVYCQSCAKHGRRRPRRAEPLPMNFPAPLAVDVPQREALCAVVECACKTRTRTLEPGVSRAATARVDIRARAWLNHR
jgi:hypothetical protein